jgi:molecular chaperone DnaJ
LGAEVKEPTLEGDEKLAVLSGTQPARFHNCATRASPHLRSSGKGDQLVIVNVEIPRTADQRTAPVFEQLAKPGQRGAGRRNAVFIDVLKDVLGG